MIITDEFIRRYKMTLERMVLRYGVGKQYLQKLHTLGELENFILQHERMNFEPVVKK